MLGWIHSLSVWTNWNMFLTFYQKDAFVLLSCCTEPYLVNYLWLLTGIVVWSYSAHLSLVWRIYWTPTSYCCSWPSSHICHHYYMCLYHILAINCCHWPPLVSCPSCHMLTVVQISPEEGDMFHKITLSFHPILAILVGQASLISSHFYWISSALPATWDRNSLKLVWEPRLIWLQEFPRSVVGSIIVQWSRHH